MPGQERLKKDIIDGEYPGYILGTEYQGLWSGLRPDVEINKKCLQPNCWGPSELRARSTKKTRPLFSSRLEVFHQEPFFILLGGRYCGPGV